MASSRFSWLYATAPQAKLGDRRISLPMGRVLGGSSSLNGMLYVRGAKWDYDHWAELGCPGWSYDDVLPFFRKSESNERGASEYHGADGPLRVRKGTPGTPICEAFLAACAAAGEKLNDDFNGAEQEGFGHYDNTIHRGRRWSGAAAFLRPAERRGNLTVMVGTTVRRVLIENGVARGVEVLSDRGSEIINSDAEVILCGGVIGTPQLLMLSGFGPADHLRSIGIDVCLDAPGVGDSLQDHIGYRVSVDCPLPVSAFNLANPVNAFAAGVRYAVTGGGPLGMPSLPTGGFFKARSASTMADAQIHLTIAKVPEAKEMAKGGIPMPSGHGFSIINQGRPASRGRLSLRSADPKRRPLIDPNYLAEASDRETLFAAVARAGEILMQPELRRFITRPDELAKQCSDRETVSVALAEAAGSTFHPVGTCRMGSDDAAVVDPQLRVYGVRNLRIADASIMPALINGNTNAASIMIGERAATFITGR
jgi:choline dehydrogenase